MSQDLTDPPTDSRRDTGGYFVLPRKVRAAVILSIVAAAFGLGTWIALMQVGVSEAKAAAQGAHDDVEEVKESVRRIERYLCVECRTNKSVDCSDICVIRRRMRLEAR